ncbi:MAG: hypothetical protein U0838_11860 [Chloroflexota bacterium]
MAVAVAVPLSLKIFAAIQRAPGAMPIDVLLASPPTMTPMVAAAVAAPGRWAWWGWSYGSNQVRAAAPARREVRMRDVHA